MFLLSATSVVVAQTINKTTLSLDGAEKVIAAAKAEAKRLNAPGGVIAVVDDGGNLMALERLDGTFAAGANISIGKARTAVQFKKPTKAFEDIIKNGRTAMVALKTSPRYRAASRSPSIARLSVVSASAAQQPRSRTRNWQLPALKRSKRQPQKPPRIFDIRSGKGRGSRIRKGRVLVDGTNRNYMIHTSRREKAGMAEIHEQDADLIRVVDGKATFVTGGKVVDPTPSAPARLAASHQRRRDTRDCQGRCRRRSCRSSPLVQERILIHSSIT